MRVKIESEVSQKTKMDSKNNKNDGLLAPIKKGSKNKIQDSSTIGASNGLKTPTINEMDY